MAGDRAGPTRPPHADAPAKRGGAVCCCADTDMLPTPGSALRPVLLATGATRRYAWAGCAPPASSAAAVAAASNAQHEGEEGLVVVGGARRRRLLLVLLLGPAVVILAACGSVL